MAERQMERHITGVAGHEITVEDADAAAIVQRSPGGADDDNSDYGSDDD
jgi:hypothetical protein